ncbi:hypothetical protein N9X25_07610 [Verrucomicrobiales bacterium]|nr:hypothetical protein [Verrucomicrobiales bacterium]
MEKKSTHLLLGCLAIGIAITGLSTPEVSAQVNERRVETPSYRNLLGKN